VLLPVYNGAPTLPQAIESILRQDDSDFELLIIDDASSDGSAEVIRRYAENDPRVTPIVHEDNAGLAATLNEGLERARHDLVARMDQDDESLPSRLRVQHAFMRSRPTVVVAGSWVRHMGATPDHDRVVELPHTPREVARVLPRLNCLYHPSVMMRRPEVLAAGGYRGEFKNAEDYELWLRLARRHDLANIPQPLLRYRFSVRGMTLGRKWEQLFYVHLAQEINREPGLTLDEATRRARRAIAAVDRRQFMQQVARGTASELAGLHLWRDALRLARSFAADVGLVTAGGLSLYVLAAWARS
jgi:glycosyltransferase involved in cell wall biosynthesis